MIAIDYRKASSRRRLVSFRCAVCARGAGCDYVGPGKTLRLPVVVRAEKAPTRFVHAACFVADTRPKAKRDRQGKKALKSARRSPSSPSVVQ